MRSRSPYDQRFYRGMRASAETAADVVAPIVTNLVRPGSVVDVGCGLGHWLVAFQRQGVPLVLGVEGNHLVRTELVIAQDQCVTHDLREPLHLPNTFDLVLSLEVAEHLPAECASTFISTLVSLGPIVLFSAAIPFQGGTSHQNEQWPEYWAAIFKERGYVAVDVIRPLLWDNPRVPAFYAQNMFLYVQESTLSQKRALQEGYERASDKPLATVHPDIYAVTADPARWPLRRALRLVPVALRESTRRRIRAVRSPWSAR